MNNNLDPNREKYAKVQSFKEFVNACIYKLLFGGAALIVFYFICKWLYDSYWLQRWYEALVSLL